MAKPSTRGRAGASRTPAPASIKRVLSLGGGTHAYVICDGFKTRHVAVGSDEFTDAVLAQPDEVRDLIVADVAALAAAAAPGAWDVQAELLEAAAAAAADAEPVAA